MKKIIANHVKINKLIINNISIIRLKIQNCYKFNCGETEKMVLGFYIKL